MNEGLSKVVIRVPQYEHDISDAERQHRALQILNALGVKAQSPDGMADEVEGTQIQFGALTPEESLFTESILHLIDYRFPFARQ